jgi:hypothetical protein
MIRRLLFALALLGTLPLVAQTVALTVTKSGSDVVLTWTGGTGPFEAIRSDSPSMTTRTLSYKDASSPKTFAGDASDGAFIHYYVVSDSTAPTLAIATPVPAFTAAAPCICATGTSTGATAVYVDTHAATGTATWAACADTTGVPLAIQADPKQSGTIVITASAVDANGNWAWAAVSGSYTGNPLDRVPCKARSQGM